MIAKLPTALPMRVHQSSNTIAGVLMLFLSVADLLRQSEVAACWILHQIGVYFLLNAFDGIFMALN